MTGPGGHDVGAFTASIDVPGARLVWTNIPTPTTTIDRTQDFTATWTGGIPDTQVTISGAGLVNGVTVAFLCAAPVSAGQFTIPSYALLNIPPTGSSVVSPQLTLLDRVVLPTTIPGLDVASIAYSEGYTVSLKFQ
jgi:hypothetical protein